MDNVRTEEQLQRSWRRTDIATRVLAALANHPHAQPPDDVYLDALANESVMFADALLRVLAKPNAASTATR
jgi:hypothetical protein